MVRSLVDAVNGVAVVDEKVRNPESFSVSLTAKGNSCGVNATKTKCEPPLRKKLGDTNLFRSFSENLEFLFWPHGSTRRLSDPSWSRQYQPHPDGDALEPRHRWSRSTDRFLSRARVGGGRFWRSPDLDIWSPSATWIRETGRPIWPAERSSATRFSASFSPRT